MNEKINLQELSNLLAEKSEISKKEAESFLKEFVEVVSTALLEEHLVKIKQLGTFKLSVVNDRESVDVATGERVLIPSHYKVNFSPEKNLADTINEPFNLFEAIEVNEDTILDEKENSIDEEVTEKEEIIKKETTVIEEETVVEKETTIEEEIVEIKNETTIEEPAKVKEIIPLTEELTTSKKEDLPVVVNIANNDDNDDKKERKKTHWGVVACIIVLLALAGVFAYFQWEESNEKSYIFANQSKTNEIIAEEITLEIQPEEETIGNEPIEVDKEEIPLVEDIIERSTEQEAKKRKLKAGERLTLIALDEYGDKSFWVYIYEENKKIIKNPNNVPVGLTLTIPPASKYQIDKNNEQSILKAKEIAEKLK